RSRLQRWPLLGAAAYAGWVVANLLDGDLVSTALGVALANGVEVALCAGLMRWLVGPAVDLTRVQPLLRFVVCAGVIAPFASSLIAAYILASAGHRDLWRNIVEWYPVDALGLLIITPALMTFTPEAWREFVGKARDGGVVAPVVALAGALVVTLSQNTAPLQFLIMPALLFCAVRLGVMASALGILATSVAAVWATLTGHGPLMTEQGDVVVRLHALQAFLLMQTLVVLPIAAVLADRTRLEASLKASLADAKLAENRAAESEARYRLLADSSTDVVVKVDRNDVIQYVSPSVARYGYDPEQLLGATGYDLIHPDDRPKAEAMVGAVFAKAEVDGLDSSYRLRTASGGYVWFEGSRTIIKDEHGEPIALVSQLRDISERVAAMETLADSELRYRTMAERATDLICRATPEGTLTYVSPSAREMLGYDPSELVGRTIEHLIHPDDFAQVQTWYRAFLRRERAETETIRYRARRKDGRWIWVESSPSAVRNVDGRVVEVFDVQRDIGARVQTEENMRRAQEAAEAATATKSQFLANMSHEIRTPLTAILGFAGLLSSRDDLSDDARRHVERISGAGQALLAIVNDILDFSSLEAGEIAIKPKPARPATILTEILELFQAQAGEKGLSLKLQLGELPPYVSLDADRLRQVLVNLLGNAVKFTDAGAVTLTAAYDAAAGRLSVGVRDTGVGLKEEEKAMLFQRFSQIDGSLARKHKGTGLGLAISRALVEAMGGEIGLVSQPGSGSVFHFAIPAPSIDAPAVEVHRQPELALDLRILVADDNATNRELARTLLATLGAEVTEVEDGQAAVDKAKALPFDVVLMDLRMPNLDGVAAARRIRHEPGPNQNIPILAFTADVQSEQPNAELGLFADVVRKPIVAAELLTALAGALGYAAEPVASAEGV
ncbi:MAG TPA: PAS domain S-box protein, partial [Caulobacteraceae bacterium]|nr:PAS domain S-box protein [Caulobacteraceae bacterium]